MSDPATCGTCKFRGKEIEAFESADAFEQTPTGYFFCTRIKHHGSKPTPHGEHALVVDGSGYFAALCVENDFGCTLHEPT